LIEGNGGKEGGKLAGLMWLRTLMVLRTRFLAQSRLGREEIRIPEDVRCRYKKA